MLRLSSAQSFTLARCGYQSSLRSTGSNFWMPAANQLPLPALRIRSTGVAQEDGGGGGDSTSSILKSPFAARGTGLVLRSTNGATFSQMSVAKTVMLAA